MLVALPLFVPFILLCGACMIGWAIFLGDVAARPGLDDEKRRRWKHKIVHSPFACVAYYRDVVRSSDACKGRT